MDPISLGTVFNGLVTIAHAVMQKIEKLDANSKKEMKAAKEYRKALVSFSNDVETASVKLHAILQMGNKKSVAALLDSPDGQEVFKRLSTALISADDLLKKLERAADALLLEMKKERKHDLTMLLSDADADNERFNSILDKAIARLDDCRTEIVHDFDEFSGLFDIYSQSQSSPSLPVPPIAVHRHGSRSPCRTPLNSIQLSFYDRPFDILVNESCALELADDLAMLTSDKDRVDVYTRTMKELAERWVEDELTQVTVEHLGKTQTEMIRNLRHVVDVELEAFECEGQEIPATEALRCAHFVDIKAGLEKAISREESQKFSVAFCGMVKAGKSLFLNAVIGCMILPSDELPSTAWPCRVRHVPGQLTPSLEIDAPYFQNAVESLRSQRFGDMMENYTPPKETDLFSALLDDLPESTAEPTATRNVGEAVDRLKAMNRKREIYKSWVDLHPTTKSNLLRFEKGSYRIPEGASGEEHVLDLLGQVNDVVRLCRRLNVPLPSKKPTMWPLLQIEFDSLRDENFKGVFEFVDLPGVGESYSDFHSFEDLVRGVAKEVNAVVPIVSFKEVSKDDWRQQLPDIMKTGVGRAPELVLCTHLDQVAKDRVAQQVASVAKTFWPRAVGCQHRVLRCSSRMGFSARLLLEKSRNSKPNFKDIWIQNSIEYDCAEKILGAHKPESTFNHLSFEVWRRTLIDQLAKSGLQETIKRLITDMVLSSHQRALMDEGAVLHKQLHKAISNQHRTLLAMRRSAEDREEAYREFETVRESFKHVLQEWSLTSSTMQLESSKKLQHSFQILDREGISAAQKAVDDMYKSFKSMGSSQQQIETNEKGELVFCNVSAAEIFLQQVQRDLHISLSNIKRMFVGLIRNLANRSRTELFSSLKTKIQLQVPDDVQPELKEEIVEELNDRGATVETLAFSTIRRKVMHTVATRHNAASAYRALQETIAQPFLKQKPIDVFAEHLGDELGDDEETKNGLEELGFMLRAPIAAIAVVPWLLGSPIWPFMKRSEKYELNKEAFLDELQKKVVAPFFDALKKEGQKTLDQMTLKSSEVAKNAVKEALANEEQRYESERSLDNQPSSAASVAKAVKPLLNFIAADAALMKLQEHLKGLPRS